MQSDNKISYAYQLPADRQLFYHPNGTDVIASKKEVVTLESGQKEIMTVFFRVSPEKLQQLKSSKNIQSNQKTVDEYKEILRSLGCDDNTIEKGVIQLKKETFNSKNDGSRKTPKLSEKKENELLRSKSLSHLAKLGKLVDKKAHREGTIDLDDVPIPANLAEDTFKSAKNSKKMLFIDETCQPYKYTPKYKIPPIEINKPRNAGPNPTANTAFSVQDVVNTSAPITTTDTTPGLPQADNTTNPQIPLIKKTKPKPLPKPSQRANNQQSKTEALRKPPPTMDEKRGKQLTSGEGITLPELPDDD